MTCTDLCPMCGVLREMDVSGYRRVSIDEEGKKKNVLTRVHHCSTCFCFVRCEDVDDKPENLEGVIMDEEEMEMKKGEETLRARA